MPSATGSRSRPSGTAVRPPQVAKGGKEGAGMGWTEPPLEQARPSYEDHGGAPYGVLEDMLPLGQPPNAKVKARVRPEPAGAKRTALGKNAAGGLVSDSLDTPEMTPALEDAPVTSPDLASLSHQPLIIFDDDKDQDYMPRQSKKIAKTRVSRSSLARTAASSPAAAPTPTSSTPTPVPPPAPAVAPAAEQNRSRDTASPRSMSNGASVAAGSSTTDRASRSASPVKTQSLQAKAVSTSLDAIVDAAVKRSREVNNPILGLAIREIYHQSFDDEKIRNLLLAILNKSATSKQSTEFRTHISRAKKLVKSREDSSRKTKKSPTRRNGTMALTEPTSRPPKETPAVPLHRPKISIRVNLPKKKAVAASPTNKPEQAMSVPTPRPRSGSASSTSSLSSLTSLDEDGMDIDSDEETNGRTQPSVQTPDMSVSDKDPRANNLSAAQAIGGGSLKRSSAEAEIDGREEKALAAKKQKLSESIDRVDRSTPSFVRSVHHQPSKFANTNNNTISPPVQLKANGHPHGSSPARGDSGDDAGSPLTDISSPPSARRGTPRTTENITKSVKKKAKTKQSPVKKQTANYGGETNSSGGRESPIGYDEHEESDNNDFCSSCRGSGFLLCCDGCDRSFHFACLDPPLSQDASELQEPWFCFKCVALRAQPQKQQRGLFSALLTNLDKRNPSIFSLPQGIREYFDGVATGKDGRFLELVNNKTRGRTGYDELPDNFKVRDAKGQSILCSHCGQSSVGRREIITCDLCNAHWHLDCLDPPLANAPFRDQWGRKVRDWICPLHIDHELREMDISRLAERQLQRDRKVFMRKPRNAKVVDTSLTRGFVNNGVIEVVNDESEDESDFYDDEVSGVVYRLPAKGIKLDFIDRVHRTKHTPQDELVSPTVAPPPLFPSRLNQPEFARRSLLEQQLALSLLQFADGDNALDLSKDRMENLLGAVIAEAPTEVVTQMLEGARAQASASSSETEQAEQRSDEQERQGLEMLQALISRKLAALSRDS